MKSYYLPRKIFLIFVMIPLFFLLYSFIDNVSVDSLKWISFALCWAGIIQMISHIISWKKLTKGWFSLQTIFLIFCFLFNYGQCFLWAFNIHLNNEIGSSLLYYKFDVTSLTICKSQIITLAMIYAMHVGMMFVYGRKNQIDKKNEDEKNEDKSFNCIGANILFTIITPITLYCTIKNYSLARTFGYWSIYYGNTAYSINSILVLISMMFFASLVSVLVFNKKGSLVKKIAITFFIINSLFQFMSGDRGFVYQICILIFWYMQREKINITKIKMIPYVIFGYIGVALLTVLKDIRSEQISFSTLFNALTSVEKSPISSALFEMGSSMSPLVAIVAYGNNPYPYGNSFIFTLPGMISERLITLFGIPYESLANWFSFNFLNLTSGAAFSIVAELFMNFGLYYGVFFAILLGILLGRLFKINYTTPFKEAFSISTVAAFISITRNTFQTGMKTFFWGVIIYFIVLYIINIAIRNKNNN